MRMLAALFLLTTIFLTGCGTDVMQNSSESTEENTIEENGTATEANEETTETETEEPQVAGEEGTEEATSEETTEEATEETAEADQEIIEGLEAVYIGQADTHSIEVETTEQGSMIFQTLDTDVDFDTIKDGSNVTIDYYVDENGQNILQNITVVN